MFSVHAVVVAFNRRDLLHSALTALMDQSHPLDRVHVVDNASSDGTASMVREEFPQVVLHELDVNTGGAGGFAAGLAFALADGADLVWLMDDDTVSSPSALEALASARERYGTPPPAAIASRVLWTDGRDHPVNTPRVRPGVSSAERVASAAVGCSNT